MAALLLRGRVQSIPPRLLLGPRRELRLLRRRKPRPPRRRVIWIRGPWISVACRRCPFGHFLFEADHDPTRAVAQPAGHVEVLEEDHLRAKVKVRAAARANV